MQIQLSGDGYVSTAVFENSDGLSTKERVASAQRILVSLALQKMNVPALIFVHKW